jgi:hypothetical protein
VRALLSLRFVRQRADSNEITLHYLALTTEPEMVQRTWDSSGFYARIGSPSPSRDSAVNGSHWRELYRAALFELDLGKLSERVKAAEEAIHARTSLNGNILSEERIAMQDATSALNVLKAGIKHRNPRIKDQGL